MSPINKQIRQLKHIQNASVHMLLFLYQLQLLKLLLFILH